MTYFVSKPSLSGVSEVTSIPPCRYDSTKSIYGSITSTCAASASIAAASAVASASGVSVVASSSSTSGLGSGAFEGPLAGCIFASNSPDVDAESSV